MKEPKFIITEFDRYKTSELWQTNSDYEIRTRNTQEPDLVKQISQEEALQFRIEAERQQAKWAEVERDHETVASYSDKYGNFDLEKLMDGTFRILEYCCGAENVDDYHIKPCDPAQAEEFKKLAYGFRTE